LTAAVSDVEAPALVLTTRSSVLRAAVAVAAAPDSSSSENESSAMLRISNPSSSCAIYERGQYGGVRNNIGPPLTSSLMANRRLFAVGRHR